MKKPIEISLLTIDTGCDGVGFNLLGWCQMWGSEKYFQSALLGITRFIKSPTGYNVRWRIDFLFMTKLIWRRA